MAELKHLICDTCGENILEVSSGYVEWQASIHKQWGFKVIHSFEKSPRSTPMKCLYYPNDELKSDLPLSDFFEPDRIGTIESLDGVNEGELGTFLQRLDSCHIDLK